MDTKWRETAVKDKKIPKYLAYGVGAFLASSYVTNNVLAVGLASAGGAAAGMGITESGAFS